MRFFLRKRSLVFLAAALALLVGVISSSYLLVPREQAEQARVQRSLEILIRLSHVLSLLQDAETGQRGYLLTHNETYLRPYDAAVPTIGSEVAALRQIRAASGRETGRFDGLAADARAKLDELRETIDLARENKQGAALTMVGTDRGKAAMDRIRDAIQTMSADERKMLSEEQARSLRTASITRTLTLAALLLSVLLGALMLRDARQVLVAATRANDALEAANQRILDEMRQKEQVERLLAQSQ